MMREGDGQESRSRFEESQRPTKNGGLFKIFFIIIVVIGMAAWGINDMLPVAISAVELEELDGEDILATEQGSSKEKLSNLKEKLEESLEEKEEIAEERTAAFYYDRGIERDNAKNYAGAVEDYSMAIALASKYSDEMWNSLNNRAIIKVQQNSDYKGARADFTKIISIENNRYDGEINETSLEAAYTNRAYVKRQLGDKEGACDDLYEALGLGVESSVSFIEKQIDKHCL